MAPTWKSCHFNELAFSQHGNEDRKCDLDAGHSLMMRQKRMTHSVATQNTIPMSPMALQCSLPSSGT